MAGRRWRGGVFVRRARPGEATRLSELALRSKAHWGYAPAFLDACRRELTLTPAEIATRPVFVLEGRGRILGFYGLERLGAAADLAYMFVEPTAIGRGVGRHLWRHAVDAARRLGTRELSIESDPNALEFYLAMGARRVGDVASTVWPGRTLPLLRFALVRAQAAPAKRVRRARRGARGHRGTKAS